MASFQGVEIRGSSCVVILLLIAIEPTPSAAEPPHHLQIPVPEAPFLWWGGPLVISRPG